MTFDLFSFSGEYDMLEIRFNLLDKHVDKFIIVEGTETFSGLPKPLYWAERDKDRFEQWENKVVYEIVNNYNDADINSQLLERDYVDQPAFKRAFYQKESLRKALEALNPNDEDIVYYGDCDEVWKPQEVDDKVHKLRQLCYSYYLNNRSSEDWRGTIVTKWKNLKNSCLNDMRANPIEEDILENGGWHFTNMGGIEAVLTKLESYDHQEVNIPWVKDGLQARMDENIDYLGREFKFWIDDSQLPKYILDNKEKYAKLWKS